MRHMLVIVMLCAALAACRPSSSAQPGSHDRLAVESAAAGLPMFVLGVDPWADPVGAVRVSLAAGLTGLGLPAPAVELALAAIGVTGLATGCLLFTLLITWMERRLLARMQDRIGPNRVGPRGLLQPVADIVKLMTRESVTPSGADRLLYNLAPFLALIAILLMWAVIPFAVNILGADLNVGALVVVGAGSISTLAFMLAGWSSGNKYSLLGAFRASAQLVSYEVPMILSLLAPVLLARSMSLPTIVAQQGPVWFIALAPVAALVFFVTSVAEAGRAPFDLLEAESEIATGYNIEYGGMKFGIFMAAEFLHGFTVGALTAVLFLGGWQGPYAERYPLLGAAYFSAKAFLGYFAVVWLRATLPRIRIDHMLELNWKYLVPLAVAALLVTMLTDKLVQPYAALGWTRPAALLAVNVALALTTVWLLAREGRRLRAADARAAPRGG